MTSSSCELGLRNCLYEWYDPTAITQIYAQIAIRKLQWVRRPAEVRARKDGS